jgi:dodecin
LPLAQSFARIVETHPVNMPGMSNTRANREAVMDDHVYRVIQIVGSSDKSIDDAIRMAVARASKTLRELRWFEVVETRGHINDGKVQHFQVTLKVGFTLEGD